MSRRGFTLLEVMVALAILAMSLVAAFDVVGNALRNHERTRHLELATELCRAKLAEVEARYEEDGFRDFDESDEGTFEEEGHPEVAWSVKTLKPTVELGADGVVKALTGAEGGLEGLLGMATGEGGGKGGKASGEPTTSALSGLMAAGGKGGLAVAAGTSAFLGAVQGQLVSLGEEIKKGVRQVRLSVSWQEGERQEGFTVVTHLVVLTPLSQQVTGAAAVGTTGAAGAGTPPPGRPGFNTDTWLQNSGKKPPRVRSQGEE